MSILMLLLGVVLLLGVLGAMLAVFFVDRNRKG
jgi:hypothetical protein